MLRRASDCFLIFVLNLSSKDNRLPVTEVLDISQDSLGLWAAGSFLELSCTHVSVSHILLPTCEC